MLPYYIFCIGLVFSLYACNARPLGRASDLKPVPISRKEIRPSQSDDQSTSHHHLILGAKMDETDDHETRPLIFEDGPNVEEASYPTKRDTEIREMKKEAEGRSTLQSLARHGDNDVEEKVDSKEHEMLEDVVAMDYAQPQRKPPIHNNKKP